MRLQARADGRVLGSAMLPLLHAGGIGADELIPAVAALIVVLALIGLGVWVVRAWKEE